MRVAATITALLFLGGCEVEHKAVTEGTGGWPGRGGIAAGGAPADGGTGGVGAAAGGNAGQDGAGGVAGGGAGGTGGDSGNDGPVLPEPRCTADELARMEAPSQAGRDWGFKGLSVGADPREATVIGRGGSALRLRMDSGDEGTFSWPGSLLLENPDGSKVRIASRSTWNVLVSEAGTFAVLQTDGLGGPPRGGFPHEAMEMIFATQCYFPAPEWEGAIDDCSMNVPPGRLVSVVVGGDPLTSTLPTVIGSYRTGIMGGWTIQNHRSVYLPGYSDDTCIVESIAAVLVTAYTPFAEWAPF